MLDFKGDKPMIHEGSAVTGNPERLLLPIYSALIDQTLIQRSLGGEQHCFDAPLLESLEKIRLELLSKKILNDPIDIEILKKHLTARLNVGQTIQRNTSAFANIYASVNR